jgi:hypothetical protein
LQRTVRGCHLASIPDLASRNLPVAVNRGNAHAFIFKRLQLQAFDSNLLALLRRSRSRLLSAREREDSCAGLQTGAAAQFPRGWGRRGGAATRSPSAMICNLAATIATSTSKIMRGSILQREGVCFRLRRPSPDHAAVRVGLDRALRLDVPDASRNPPRGRVPIKPYRSGRREDGHAGRKCFGRIRSLRADISLQRT